ncbi:MAG: hypothetical protein NC300_02770 [Bacteroidales bacterium]|nr:hypothetical protein [Clostridium sp.]MCM1203042.1 hypothetical protein [Bacteroidales bacterium]
MEKHLRVKKGTFRKKLLRMAALGLCSVMLAGNIFAGGAAVSHAAAVDETASGKEAAPVMKSRNLSWDLKKNKAVRFSTDNVMYNKSKRKYYSSKKTGTVTMKNFKKVSKGDNYKVTFTLVYKLPANFSRKEVNGVANAGDVGDVFGTWYFYGAYDYQTGEGLLNKQNSCNVKVKPGKWKHSAKETFYGTNGAWYSRYKNSSIKLTITYPKSYKGLCILAGGYRKCDSLNGGIVFTEKTKKDKQYFHAMRLK